MEMVVSGWLEDDTLNIGTELSEMIEEFMVEANIAIRAKPELLVEYDVHLSVRWNTLKDLIMKIRHNNLESLITDEQKLDHRKEEIASLTPFASANTKKQTDRKMHADGGNATTKARRASHPIIDGMGQAKFACPRHLPDAKICKRL